MENTLYPNDIIVVNKLKYGPKLPQSPFEIPWLNIALYFNTKAKKRISDNWWSYKRLSGFSTIKNGDVIVFTMFNNNMVMVKRCMAVAGDTITIKKGDVYINDKYFSPSSLVRNKYKLKVSNIKLLYEIIDSLNLDLELNRTFKGDFITTISLKEKNELKKFNCIENLDKVTNILTPESSAYPNSKYNQWNFDEYGPYIIPKKGMVINLTSRNYSLYNKVINEHEDVIIKKINGTYFINEKKAVSYTFKQDYYFMMGDNRKDSMDSRYWGLVPEKRIVGKVQLVLWSYYQDEFQWNRLFKAVK